MPYQNVSKKPPKAEKGHFPEKRYILVHSRKNGFFWVISPWDFVRKKGIKKIPTKKYIY
jgi:hypothetical protein